MKSNLTKSFLALLVIGGILAATPVGKIVQTVETHWQNIYLTNGATLKVKSATDSVTVSPTGITGLKVYTRSTPGAPVKYTPVVYTKQLTVTANGTAIDTLTTTGVAAADSLFTGIYSAQVTPVINDSLTANRPVAYIQNFGTGNKTVTVRCTQGTQNANAANGTKIYLRIDGYK